MKSAHMIPVTYPVLGYRRWVLVPEETYLYSNVLPHRWLSGNNWAVNQEHWPLPERTLSLREVPHLNNNCGFWAFTHGTAFRCGIYGEVQGVVALSGRVIVHTNAVRGEYARVVAIRLPWSVGEVRSRQRYILRRAYPDAHFFWTGTMMAAWKRRQKEQTLIPGGKEGKHG